MATVKCLDLQGNAHLTNTCELQWRPAAYGVILRDEKVMLLKHCDGGYDLPGGGLNFGEDHLQAVIREVKEETGMIVCAPVLLGIETSFFRAAHSDDRSYHSILMYFSCTYVDGEPSMIYLDEVEKTSVESLEWVSLEEIDHLKIASTVDFRPYIRQAYAANYRNAVTSNNT